MIQYKTEEEIKIMTEGGNILKKVYQDLKKIVKPNIRTIDIDTETQRLIKLYGGEISFNKVPGYKWATCITLNEQVVHTPPSERLVNESDIITIDMGVYYKGFHVDYSDTFIVGKTNSDEIDQFLQIGRDTLYKAIDIVTDGVYIGEISSFIQSEIEGKGYFVMRELTGHGVGHELHEDPLIPGYLEKPIEKTPKLKNGMVVAIEVIYSMGTTEIEEEEGNNWSIVTKDGSLSACFEHTVAINKNKPFILT
ncbi:MAG TPA: type I methionyl aminopeptidase [Candidatus Nitrosocosmicus sp.]|nr:type I methionyl aminopeptidase [Candidatus Nitrosocosmicus sp.]